MIIGSGSTAYSIHEVHNFPSVISLKINTLMYTNIKYCLYININIQTKTNFIE